ncbi:MAG TPA: hypothetical protein VFW24_01235 [Acidimicrobiales bacterium]|nr:hypothetical protein [Acidimicrobiales bacterium]
MNATLADRKRGLTTKARRMGIITAAIGGLVGMGSSAAFASGGTVSWKGQTWDVSSNASATAAPDGSQVTITRDSGTADATLHVNRLVPLVGTDSFVNQYGTPWIQVSYLDNGASRGVDFLVDDEVTTGNPRLQAGSLFSADSIGWARDNANAVADPPVFAVPGSRTAGTAHTIYVGERPDGTIDYNVDGIWYSSTEFKDHGEHMNFNDVYLRLRGNFGTTATFTDLQYGDQHVSSKDGCKNGGWQTGSVYKNQGECVSHFASSK